MDSQTRLPIFARILALHDDVEHSLYLLQNEVHVLGRLPEVCDIVVHRRTVSRIHARIERRGASFVITTISPLNKTFVNGTEITEEYVLQHGDKIGLSQSEPILVFDDQDPTDYVAESLRYDDKTMQFFLHDQSLNLTPQQARLLQHLYRNRGAVCTRQECARAVWGDDYLPEYETDNLDKVIFGLRRTLRRTEPNIDMVKIQRGVGFFLTL